MRSISIITESGFMRGFNGRFEAVLGGGCDEEYLGIFGLELGGGGGGQGLVGVDGIEWL